MYIFLLIQSSHYYGDKTTINIKISLRIVAEYAKTQYK